jgi:glycosyltransferase involved in cell wall biosynthesis
MRVLYITHYGILEPLGQTQILPYLLGLARTGIQIEIHSFEKERFFSDAARVEHQAHVLQSAGINWRPRKYGGGSSLASLISDVIPAMVQIMRSCANGDPDLLHVRAHVPYLCAWPAAVFRKIPVLFDFRGFLAEEYADAGLWRAESCKFRAVKVLEKRMAQSSSAVVVLTQPAAEYFRRNYGIAADRISVIPCCVDLERFRPAPETSQHAPGRPLKIVYSGSTTGRYRLAEMFRFLDWIRDARPGSQMTVLTSGNIAQVEAEAGKLGFPDDVVRVRSVQPEEVPRELAHHDLGLILIAGTLGPAAASPTKIGEYLACGLPVVAEEAIGDAAEILLKSGAGCLIDSSRPDSWGGVVKAALELCDNPDTPRKAACTAQRHYSLANGIGQYAKAYRFAAGQESANLGSAPRKTGRARPGK